MRTVLGFLFIFYAASCMAGGMSDIRAGNKAYDKQKYGEAYNFYTSAADKEGAAAQKGLYNAAAALYRLKDYSSADKTYTEVIETDGNLKQSALFNRANALYNAGQKDKALESLKEAILLNPKDAQAIHNMQFILLEKQEDKDKSSNQDKEDNKESDDKQQSDDKDNNQNKDNSENKENPSDSNKQQNPKEEEQKSLSKDTADRILQMVDEKNLDTPPLDVKEGPSASGLEVEKDW